MSGSAPITGDAAFHLDAVLRVEVEAVHASGTGRLKTLLRDRTRYAAFYPPLVFDEAEFTLNGRKAA